MTRNPDIVIRIDRRLFLVSVLALLVTLSFAVLSQGARAQKAQENFKQKINIADDQGGVAIASSADGKYVYVAGAQGVMVSEDFGRTGSWVQTAKLK